LCVYAASTVCAQSVSIPTPSFFSAASPQKIAAWFGDGADAPRAAKSIPANTAFLPIHLRDAVRHYIAPHATTFNTMPSSARTTIGEMGLEHQTTESARVQENFYISTTTYQPENTNC
jgi:hypothetical protein